MGAGAHRRAVIRMRRHRHIRNDKSYLYPVILFSVILLIIGIATMVTGLVSGSIDSKFYIGIGFMVAFAGVIGNFAYRSCVSDTESPIAVYPHRRTFPRDVNTVSSSVVEQGYNTMYHPPPTPPVPTTPNMGYNQLPPPYSTYSNFSTEYGVAPPKYEEIIARSN